MTTQPVPTDQNDISIAVDESEALFQSLFHLSMEGIAIHDKGIVIKANEKLATMFGTTAKEFIGQNCLDYLTNESRTAVLEEMAQSIDHPITVTATRKDGSIFHIETIGTAVTYQGKAVRMFVARDVTEQVRVIEKLSLDEEKFRSLTENAPNHIMMVNLDGIITYINHTKEGVTKEQILGKSVYDFASENYKTLVRDAYTKVFTTGESVQIESANNNPDGSLEWFQSSIGAIKQKDVVVGAVLISANITKQKNAEETLNKRSQDLEQMNTLMIGRELKMVELKKELDRLQVLKS